MRVANGLGLSWEAVIFGEPKELKLASGPRGGLNSALKAKGKAGHSGYPGLGKNATHMLVQALAALDKTELLSSELYRNTTINIKKPKGGVARNAITEDASALASFRVAARSPENIKILVERAIYKASPEAELTFSLGTGPISIDYDIPCDFPKRHPQVFR